MGADKKAKDWFCLKKINKQKITKHKCDRWG